jgi:lysyl-tRNA synthetase class I
MIKEYTIESDDKLNKTLRMHLNLEQKKKEVLKGYHELIHVNDFFEIWKCKLPYEIKLVLINMTNKDQYKIIESTAVNPSKQELQKMQAEFNTALAKEGINFMGVFDKNNY